MRGTIYLPMRISRDKHPADIHSIVTEMMAERYDLKIICSDKLNLNEVEGDILFTMKTPQVGYYDAASDICNLDSKIRLVAYIHDIDAYDEDCLRFNSNFRKYLRMLLDRADTILYTYKASFLGALGEYAGKSMYCPTCIVPSNRYLSINRDFLSRTRKCILSGCTVKDWYPLRNHAANNPGDIIEVMSHPGYGINVNEMLNNPNVYIRDKYAVKLSEYVCGLTSTFNGPGKAERDWVTYKFYEIMAAGCVLVSNWCPEMDELGFKDMVNYVKVNVDDYRDKVTDIVTRPEKYVEIASNGREFVRNDHTVEKRIETVLDNVFSGS